MTRRDGDELQSARWFSLADFRPFGDQLRFMQMGCALATRKVKPAIGIVIT